MKATYVSFTLLIAFTSGSGCGNKTEKNNTDTKGITLNSTLTLDKLTAKIEEDPGNADHYYQRGVLYYENGDQTSAIRDFTEAIRLNANYAEAYHDRGICQFELDRPDHAMADFNQAIALNDRFVEAHYNRALLFESLNLIDQAINDYNRCIQIDPKFGPAYYNRGVHLFHRNRKKACDDFKKAADLGDKDSEITYLEQCN